MILSLSSILVAPNIIILFPTIFSFFIYVYYTQYHEILLKFQPDILKSKHLEMNVILFSYWHGEHIIMHIFRTEHYHNTRTYTIFYVSNKIK